MPSQRLGSLMVCNSDSGSDSEWEDMVEGPVVTSLMSDKMATRPGNPGRSLRPSAERFSINRAATTSKAREVFDCIDICSMIASCLCPSDQGRLMRVSKQVFKGVVQALYERIDWNAFRDMAMACQNQASANQYTLAIRHIDLQGCVPSLVLRGDVTTLFDMFPSLQRVSWQHGIVKRSHPTARFPSHIQIVLDIHLDWTWAAELEAYLTGAHLPPDHPDYTVLRLDPLPCRPTSGTGTGTVAVAYHFQTSGVLCTYWARILFGPSSPHLRALLEEPGDSILSLKLTDIPSADLSALEERIRGTELSFWHPPTQVIPHVELHVIGLDDLHSLEELLLVLRSKGSTVKLRVDAEYIGLCLPDCTDATADEHMVYADYLDQVTAFLGMHWAGLQHYVQDVELNVRLDSTCKHRHEAPSRRERGLSTPRSIGRYAIASLHTTASALAHRTVTGQLCLRATWPCTDRVMLSWPTADHYEITADTGFWLDMLRPLDITHWAETKVVLRRWENAKRTGNIVCDLGKSFCGAVRDVLTNRNPDLTENDVALPSRTPVSPSWKRLLHTPRRGARVAPSIDTILCGPADGDGPSKGARAILEAQARFGSVPRLLGEDWLAAGGPFEATWIDELRYESSFGESEADTDEDSLTAVELAQEMDGDPNWEEEWAGELEGCRDSSSEAGDGSSEAGDNSSEAGDSGSEAGDSSSAEEDEGF